MDRPLTTAASRGSLKSEARLPLPNSFPPSIPTQPRAPRLELSRHVFGVGILALGCTFFAWGDFSSGLPVPNDLPHRTAFAYLIAFFLTLIGAGLQWRRYAAWAAAAVAAFYAIIVIILMDGRTVLAHYAVYGTYEDLAEQFAITAGALILYATHARLPKALAARLVLIGQLIFGICALIFGGAHFVYMNLTAPLIPTWLPPSQLFWGYLTGAAFILAGLALLTRIRARLAALLLTAMLATFALLVHIRILFTDHKSEFNWTELALNLTILGSAWLVADSLRSPPPPSPK